MAHFSSNKLLTAPVGIMYQSPAMTNTDRLQYIRTAVDQIANDEHRINCACVIASGEQNANTTLGWDEGATEEWCKLAVASIESLLEAENVEVQEFFKHHGFTW